MAKDIKRTTRKFCVTIGYRSIVVRAESEEAAIEAAIPLLYDKDSDSELPSFAHVSRSMLRYGTRYDINRKSE